MKYSSFVPSTETGTSFGFTSSTPFIASVTLMPAHHAKSRTRAGASAREIQFCEPCAGFFVTHGKRIDFRQKVGKQDVGIFRGVEAKPRLDLDDAAFFLQKIDRKRQAVRESDALQIGLKFTHQRSGHRMQELFHGAGPAFKRFQDGALQFLHVCIGDGDLLARLFGQFG